MNIEHAVTLAAEAHEGQTDKVGAPYIFHLMRLAVAVPPELAVAAVLHDIIEDTEYTTAGLMNEGVSSEDIHTIVQVTRLKDHETYAQYIERLVESGTEAALLVKQQDLIDHLFNNPNPMKSEGQRKKYQDALWAINKAIIEGRRS